MSSLPPYNPPPGARTVWLLVADGPAQLPPELSIAPAFERLVVAEASLLQPASRLAPCPVVLVVPDPARVSPGPGALLVVGPGPYVEALLRRLMGMPEGSARFVVRPGAPTVVDLLEDRAVLSRMNPGGALD